MDRDDPFTFQSDSRQLNNTIKIKSLNPVCKCVLVKSQTTPVDRACTKIQTLRRLSWSLNRRLLSPFSRET